jgi:ribosomal protein S8
LQSKFEHYQERAVNKKLQHFTRISQINRELNSAYADRVSELEQQDKEGREEQQSIIDSLRRFNTLTFEEQDFIKTVPYMHQQLEDFNRDLKLRQEEEQQLQDHIKVAKEGRTLYHKRRRGNQIAKHRRKWARNREAKQASNLLRIQETSRKVSTERKVQKV